jgi:hypothetical protein
MPWPAWGWRPAPHRSSLPWPGSGIDVNEALVRQVQVEMLKQAAKVER